MGLKLKGDVVHTLLAALRRRKYAFVTPTPATHARILARRTIAADLRDVLGWSLPFRAADLDAEILNLLDGAGALVARGDGLFASAIRVSSLGRILFAHSAYPTLSADAVFFGPDSYRFAQFIGAAADERKRVETIADIGTGAGVGAIVAREIYPRARIVATDINPLALTLADANAAYAHARVRFIKTSLLEKAPGLFDLIVANPPYIADAGKRAYRDGGGLYGGQAALDWTGAALPRLAPRGEFLLYTGAASVAGKSPLERELRQAARAAGCEFTCREIDPDVFGEELEHEAYRDVERIAVIGAVFRKP